MPNPYTGEIRMFAGDYAPRGWAICNGQLLAVSQNAPLFSLLGTTYGGDGRTTFALPDLRGRVPIHAGTGPGLPTWAPGEMPGEETVTLTVDQIASHTHTFHTRQDLTATQRSPGGNVLAIGQTDFYSDEVGTLQLDSRAIELNSGAEPGDPAEPHSNVQPFLCVTFIIALVGNRPSP
jgi:microcystin-dependent protein